MADYQDIRGLRVKYLSEDPATTVDGEVWYNSTSGTLKAKLINEAWVSTTPMTTSRQNVSGAGLQTAGVVFGGATGPATPAFLNTTEEYNGLGWSTTGNSGITAIGRAGFGTQTAAVAVGGYNTSAATIDSAEEYNGATWTAISPAAPQATRGAMGAGIETSGLVIGGEDSTVLTNTQEYNGSAWAVGGVIPAATYNGAANGTLETNSWFAGGADGFKNGTFLYGGATWTASGNLNTARDQCRGAGIATAALAFGGRTPPNSISAVTESFDGSTWTTSSATLGTAAKQMAGFGTQLAALAAGNDPAGTVAEEFTRSGDVLTAAAWSSGGNMNTSRSQMAGGGTMTAGWIAGGLAPGFSNATEEYDGAAWSSVNNYGEAARLVAGSGPQATAFATGGFTSPSAVSKATYDYDATTWTASADQPDYHYGQGAAGTKSAGFICGGSVYPASTYQNTTFEYDGEYSAGGTMTTARQYIAGAGSQTAAVMTTGNYATPPYVTNATEEYNSGVWSTTGNNLFTVRGAGMSGTQTAAICFGGSVDPGSNILTTTYDGAVWSTNPNISTSRGLVGGSKEGTQGSAWMCGGLVEGPGAHTNATEEFSGVTAAANIVTLTTS